MSTPNPLAAACALTAGETTGRRAGWQAVLDDSRARREAVDGGVRVHLDDRPGIRERLASLAAAERECCSFLDWRVETGPDRVTLAVVVPTGDPALVEAVRTEFELPRPGG